MNSLELIWNNKKLADTLKAAFSEFFKTCTQGGFEMQAPKFNESTVPFDFYGFSLLRVNTKKDSCPFVLGSSQGTFYQTVFEMLKSKDDAPVDAKTFETDLSKLLFTVLSPEFKNNQIIVDSKTVYNLPQKQLGSWEKIMVQKTLQFPIKTPKGELLFEIALIDTAFQSDKIIETFGFTEEARILVVDDSATTRKLSRHYLACAGFLNIEECIDGQAGLTKIISSRPACDLVIADWHMPNMTGIEMLKKVRAIADLKALPIILATGERNKDEVGNAIKEGVSGYIVKPFDADSLYKAMKKAHTLSLAIKAKLAATSSKKKAA